ncbi:MAG: GFA family protein [Gammaproteobacteria bacterium]|nr:GFA family protein [Gammaproteobacteria bacterium]
MHRGSCLCGDVSYRVSGVLPDFEVCHCRQCQQAQGGACVVVAPIATSAFEVLTGAERLTAYRASPDKERLFCCRCGSPLFSRRDDSPGVLRLRVGTLDHVGSARVASHAHVASKVDWCEIGDDAPRYPGPRPG